jgi:hypothetical protein
LFADGPLAGFSEIVGSYPNVVFVFQDAGDIGRISDTHRKQRQNSSPAI